MVFVDSNQASKPLRHSASSPFLTPDSALRRLLVGNGRFSANQLSRLNQNFDRLSELAEKQTPFATILTCSDSRVPPEIIFDQGLGDLFIVRVAGNVVASTELGSIEYGLSILKTPILFVLGHSGCGAVSAALGNSLPFGHIRTLVEAIQPAATMSRGQPGDVISNAVRANILFQLDQLRQSNIVARLLDEQRIKLVGGCFDFITGRVVVENILTTSYSSIRANYKNTF
ncbi:carbonic anhydrase [Leptolyngbya sp. AN03gr2]|uniref:carbonic anhydrase n=1 Tax=unclassified Leptolyngbya TaxID=2650499 RepID=UPI003D32378E